MGDKEPETGSGYLNLVNQTARFYAGHRHLCWAGDEAEEAHLHNGETIKQKCLVAVC
jgi:hypothetical protein